MTLYTDKIFNHIEQNQMNILLDEDTIKYLKTNFKDKYEKYKRFIKEIKPYSSDNNYPTRFNRNTGGFEHYED